MSTPNTRSEVMSLREFIDWFVAQIDWSPEEVSENDDLVEDLGMDSVGAVDLIVAVEDAVGGDVVMPIELLSADFYRARRLPAVLRPGAPPLRE